MANINTYLDLARESYSRTINNGWLAGEGFAVRNVEIATALGSGLQVVVFQRANERIIAFSGTQGGILSAPISQSLANARIAVGAIPNMAGRAYDIVCRQASPGKYVTLVGHSLGGAIAQVVGAWTGLHFVSFNGPGMKTHLSMARHNRLQPNQRSRSRAASAGDVVGLCFNTRSDFVGGYGSHLGKVVQVPSTRDQSHDLSAISAGLGNRVYSKPYDFLSTFVDPAAIGVAL